MADATPLDALSVRFTHIRPDGNQEDLHHIGIIYRVSAQPLAPLKTAADGEDSLGSRRFRLEEVGALSLTPFARSVIDRLKAV